MATFYYNRYSDESVLSQWSKHIQTENYITDIGSIVEINKRDLRTTINNANTEQIESITQVCGKIEDGFSELSEYLSKIKFEVREIRGEINNLASMLDWKLSLMVEEQRLTNTLLGHISQLLRIPDSQKQRIYHIEQGIKYIKNAILDGVDSYYYDDALESFKQAEKIEKKDFVTLNRMGQIYMYSKKHMDIPLAEKYFLKSAREAFAEANASGTTTSNYLKPYGNQLSIYDQNYFRAATAEAYLYASRTCYLQKKYSDAVELADKAYTLVPEFVEAGFEKAKYLCANNQENEAANVLEAVINKDRYFSIKTLTDQDLATKKPILNLINNLQQTALSSAKTGAEECKRIIKHGSKTTNILAEIENCIAKNSFLSAMKAIDLLGDDYQFPYKEYTKGPYEAIHRKEVIKNQRIIEFIKKENYSTKDFEVAKEKAKYIIARNRTISFGLTGGSIGFVVGFFKGCTLRNFSMDVGTWIGTLIAFSIFSALLGLLVASLTEPKIYDIQDDI